ncbi:pyridoxamine 5'-phosphate oxidase family protein [Palleronia rufa]|uniref:pyridoxamine 5'-phosphate oxidase family protein n=1 Tax=Palleronia rufa TaxID=1530186 RepID=UPI00190F2777|nr:pyridoxamine 5'-phosphate oxidase family protein [Palleronia rufa]
MTLEDVAEAMRNIDFGMLSTKTEGGGVASRPMSNNREVAYAGDSYFFSDEDTRTVDDIKRDPNVAVTYKGSPVAGVAEVMGKPPLFLAMEGKAELIRDKAAFERHWAPDMERYFGQGIDTPGLVFIKVHAERIHYWDGEDEGEIVL